MNKYLYAILRLKTTSWIKYWLYNKTMKIKGVLSNILEGISFYLTDSLNREFNLFQIIGRSVQDGTPTPENPIPIKNTGDNGFVNEKVSNSDGTQEQNISFPLAQGQKFMQGDYLADDGVHHVMKQWVIDDSNKNLITMVGSAYGTRRAIIMKSSLGWKISPQVGICLMNRYKEAIADFKSGRFSLNSWDQGIEIYDDRFTDLATARNLMVGTVIQIKQAQETIDPYTEEQKQAWEQIKALRTYKPVTHISSEDDLPANLKIQYWKEG